MQVRAQRRLYRAVDAVVAHSEYGRRQLVDQLGVDPGKVRVIHHGAFEYLTQLDGAQLPPELAAGAAIQGAHDAGGLVVLFFGLLRPYKGLDVLLEAWGRIEPAGGRRAELWIVGRPRMALEPLRELAPSGVRFVPRYVSDPELAACFRRADVVVLPYSSTERFDFSGVLAAALAFAKPTVLTAVGGFPELAAAGAARLVPPRDAGALGESLAALIGDPVERDRLAAAARAAAAGPYSWATAARQTLSLYQELVPSRAGA
jgi:glycosyltransferase involved in cell wall biosynthesis